MFYILTVIVVVFVALPFDFINKVFNVIIPVVIVVLFTMLLLFLIAFFIVGVAFIVLVVFVVVFSAPNYRLTSLFSVSNRIDLNMIRRTPDVASLRSAALNAFINPKKGCFTDLVIGSYLFVHFKES